MRFLLLTIALMLSLNACGYKGRLKSPMQIELEKAKEARRKAKEEAEEKKKLEKQQQQEDGDMIPDAYDAEQSGQ